MCLSFQIDLTCTLACDIAVLTNITPDHLDRYASFAAYAAAKERLFLMQSVDQVAIIAAEDAPSQALAGRLGRARLVAAAAVTDQSRWPTLQGPHNAQNAAIALAVAQALALDPAIVEQALSSYPGLPHRMERIAEKAGVLYVNDSKATNATSTAPALGAYPKIHWILGGLRKTDELDACAAFYGHIVHAYVIGAASELFAKLLRAAGISVTDSGTLDQAVRDAAKNAQAGETVLLSPACASYDQFSDYEARGAAFRLAVEELP
jgi:UDP-N-acetylmuramoylalanine--D-glutamate ligase